MNRPQFKPGDNLEWHIYADALESRIAELEKYRHWRSTSSTHWEGCWDSHYDCAMARIKQLEVQCAKNLP